MALAAAGVAALLSLVAALLLTPEPAYTAASGMAGWPRLILYAASGAILGLTATRDCLSRDIHPRGPRRGVILVALGVAASLVIAIINAARLRANNADPLGPPLWMIAMVILLAYTLFPLAQRVGWTPLWPDLQKVGLYRWLPWLMLAAIIAVAAAIRLPALGDIPQGINPDEGDRASTSIDLLHGQAPASWFDSGWFFINMVYFRVLAASLAIFGQTVFGGRMLSALCGIAFVGVIAWIGWRQFGSRVGLLAAAFATGMQVMIQHSRLITEAGPTALLWAVSIGGFLEGARSGRVWAWAVAGTAGGLSLYFYPSARLWAVGAILTVLAILAFLRSPRVLVGVAVAAIASMVAALPFLIHLSTHPDELAGRYAQTAVLDPRNQERLAYLTPPEPLPTLLALQTERTLGMFDRYPDGGGFLPINRPMFAPPLAQLTLVGAFYLLVRSWRDVRLAVLSLWFWIGLSGVALTVETPDYLRSVGMLPSLCFVLLIPLLDVVDRVAYGARAWVRTAAVPATLATALLVPEVVSYFGTFRNLPTGWAPETHEGQVIAAMGATGPVYSLELNEHMVISGWVRLLSPGTERGRLPNPGRELPILAPVASSVVRPDFFPDDGQGFSVIMSPDPNQLPYIPLLQQLYPDAQAGDGGGDQRRSVSVSPQALANVDGVTLTDGSGIARRVDHFGDVPPDIGQPAQLTWRAGVRFGAAGTYVLTAPGGSLSVDGLELPPSGALTTVAGVHFIEVRATQQVSATINGARLTPQQTYRLMDAPWGLLAHLSSPTTTVLDSTVSMAFFDPELGFVASPNVILWTGSLLAPRSGTYRMAFAAEDNMQLQVDGEPVNVMTVGPDSWRNVGVGSQVNLRAGPHRVAVILTITHGGRELARWNWVPPLESGALDPTSPWSVVPPSVLRPS